MRTVTKHYIGGELVESHGREVMESINPSNGQVIAHVTLGDEEDARRAIAAAKRAFHAYSKTTKEERSHYLRRLHEVVAARVDDLTAVMIEEYGGTRPFCEAASARAAWPRPRSWRRRCARATARPRDCPQRWPTSRDPPR